MLNYYPKNPKKVVQTLLEEKLKSKTELVIWHEVLNSSIFAFENNGNRLLSSFELLKRLNSCTDRLRALLYCPGDRTSNNFILLKQQNY